MSLTAAQVQQLIRDGLPMAEASGLIVEEREDGGIRMRQPFDPRTIRPGGTLSGPTMMGLADAAMYAAILSRLGRVEMAVTQNLNINFLARPAPAELVADAEIIRLGRRSAVLEVRVYSEGGDQLVAHVTGIYALPSGDKG
ncbi:MAG: PaaI family thioesterase [Alcanivoracaceae bacterium]|jgi:uncharacterized protein (TIGR00369 family)|nr:PaaI family thioesterase [Alcanivoracaceae bacterium]